MEEQAVSNRKGGFKKKELKIRRTWIAGYLQGAWKWGWDFLCLGNAQEKSGRCLMVAQPFEDRVMQAGKGVVKARTGSFGTSGRRKSWWGKEG